MPTNWSQEWTPTVKAAKPKTETAAKPKPYQAKMVGGINEELAMGQARTQYDAGNALRQYQMDTAKRNLQQTLGALDRARIEGYRDVGNNYAARGMLRSGGAALAENKVTTSVNEQGNAARQSVKDLADQQDLESIQALAGLQGIDYNVLQQYIAALMANKIGQTGQA
jgi:hypothetical protein